MKTEFNFIDVIERLKKALKINDDKELAEVIGMKPTTFNSRKMANSIPYNEILSLAKTRNLDFDWLLTGEGDMYRDTKNAGMDIQTKKVLDNFQALDDSQKTLFSSFIENEKRRNELEKMVMKEKRLAA